MPSIKLFSQQSKEYQESVLPTKVRARISIEMGSTQAWGRYVGLDGISMGIDTFGLSGNGDDIVKRYGFTTENVVKTVNKLFN